MTKIKTNVYFIRLVVFMTMFFGCNTVSLARNSFLSYNNKSLYNFIYLLQEQEPIPLDYFLSEEEKKQEAVGTGIEIYEYDKTGGDRCVPVKMLYGHNKYKSMGFEIDRQLTNPRIIFDYDDGSIFVSEKDLITEELIDGSYYYTITIDAYDFTNESELIKSVYYPHVRIESDSHVITGIHDNTYSAVYVHRPDDFNGKIRIISKNSEREQEQVAKDTIFDVCIGDSRIYDHPFQDDSNWNGQMENGDWDELKDHDGTGEDGDFGNIHIEDVETILYNHKERYTQWRYGAINDIGTVELMDSLDTIYTGIYTEEERVYVDGINPNVHPRIPDTSIHKKDYDIEWQSSRIKQIRIPETTIADIGKVFSIELLYENGCDPNPSAVAYIRLNDAPLPIIQTPFNICQEDLISGVSFDVTCTDHFVGAEYEWSSNDPTVIISQTGTQTARVSLPYGLSFNEKRMYDLDITVTGYPNEATKSKCSNTDTQTFTIYESPDPSYELLTKEICSGEKATLKYAWKQVPNLTKDSARVTVDWGDGSTKQVFIYDGISETLEITKTEAYIHSASNDPNEIQLFDIKLSVERIIPDVAPCAVSETQQISVKPPTVARINKFANICSGQSQTFSTGSTGYLLSKWVWYVNGELIGSGDKTTHIFPKAGTYDITLKVTGECGVDEITEKLLVGQTPTSDFTLSEGECKTITLTSTSEDVLTSNEYVWEYDNASVSEVNWENITTDNDISSDPYSVSHTFTEPENGDTDPVSYALKLTVTNKINTELTCSDTKHLEENVKIYPNPIADFSGEFEVCGEVEQFYSANPTLVHSSLDATTYRWEVKKKTENDWDLLEENSQVVDAGAKLINNSGSPVIYQLRLTVETYLSADPNTRICYNSIVKDITVNSTPKLENDENTNISLCPGSEITLDPGCTTSGVEHTWVIEDSEGEIETVYTQTYKFVAPDKVIGDGIYTVTYTVKNTNETCPAQRIYTITVSDVTITPPTLNPMIGCAGETFYFTPNVHGGTVPYTHKLESTNDLAKSVTVSKQVDPENGNLEQYSFTPTKIGTYEFAYTVTDATEGSPCDGSTTYTVKVYEKPVASVATSQAGETPYLEALPVVVCGDSVTLIGLHEGGKLLSDATNGFMIGTWTVVSKPNGADNLSLQAKTSELIVDLNESKVSNFGLYKFLWTLDNTNGKGDVACSSTESIQVHFYHPIEIENLYPKTAPLFSCFTNPKTELSIAPEINYGSESYTYHWSVTTNDGKTVPSGNFNGTDKTAVTKFTTDYIGELIFTLQVNDADPLICESIQTFHATVLENPIPSGSAKTNSVVKENKEEHSAKNPFYIVCGPTVELNGTWTNVVNDKSHSMIGQWSVFEKPANADILSFTEGENDITVNLDESNKSNFGKPFTFRWTVRNNEGNNTIGCPEYFDVKVVFYDEIAIRFPHVEGERLNAPAVCEEFKTIDGVLSSSTDIYLNPTVTGGSNTDLDQNTDYQYAWSVTDEQGKTVTENWDEENGGTQSATPIFTTDSYGTYLFTVEIKDNLQDICSTTYEEFEVVVYENPKSEAWATIEKDSKSVNLCGLEHIVVHNAIDKAKFKGAWEKISGPGSINFIEIDKTLEQTKITATTYGTYKLSWNVTPLDKNSTCDTATETITVNFYQPIETGNLLYSTCFEDEPIRLSPNVEHGYGTYAYKWTVEEYPSGVSETNVADALSVSKDPKSGSGTAEAKPYFSSTGLVPGKYVYNLDITNPDSYSGCENNSQVEVYVLEKTTSASEIELNYPEKGNVINVPEGTSNEYVTCSTEFSLIGNKGTTHGNYGRLKGTWTCNRTINDHTWNSESNSIVVSLNNDVTSPQTYVFTYTVKSGTDTTEGYDFWGCDAQSTVTITVNPKIEIVFSEDPVFLCSADEAAYEVKYTISGGSSTYKKYKWLIEKDTYSKSVEGEELSFLPNNHDGIGTYTVTLSVEDKLGTVCTASEEFDIEVLQTPDANVTVPYIPSAENAKYGESNPYLQCDYTINLDASDPEANENEGKWSLVKGPGSVTNWSMGQNNHNTSATVSREGIYQFRWTVYNKEKYNDKNNILQEKVCDDFEDVYVEFFTPPTINSLISYDETYSTVNGKDLFCIDQNNASPKRYAYLEVKTTSAITGVTWTLISGDGTIETIDHPTALDSSAPTALEQKKVRILVDTYGEYTFRVTLTNGLSGCEISEEITIQFHEIPDVDFKLTDADCSPMEISLSPVLSTYETEDTLTYEYEWLDDTGALDENIHTPNAFTYTNVSDNYVEHRIQLKVTNKGCVAPLVTKTTKVMPQPEAFFKVESDADCSPVLSEFTNLSEWGDEFMWDFDGDKTIDKTTNGMESVQFEYINDDPTVDGFIPTLYAIQKTGGFACLDSFQTHILVKSKLEAKLLLSTSADEETVFVGDGTEAVCAGTKMKFRLFDPNTNKPGEYTKSIFSYKYDTDGDGVDEEFEVIKFNTYYMTESFVNNGTKARMLTISASAWTGNCDVVVPEQKIQILPSIETGMTYSTEENCSSVVTFINQSQEGSDQYHIDFGDGEEATFIDANAILVHEYPANDGYNAVEYKAVLSVHTSQCSIQKEYSVFIYPMIVASFSTYDNYICSGEDIVLENTTVNTKDWEWIVTEVTDPTNPQIIDFEDYETDNNVQSLVLPMDNESMVDRVFEAQLKAISIYPTSVGGEDCYDESEIQTIRVAPKFESILVINDGTKDTRSDEIGSLEICSDQTETLAFGAIYKNDGIFDNTNYALYIDKKQDGNLERVSSEVNDPENLSLNDPNGVLTTDAEGKPILDIDGNPITSSNQYFRNGTSTQKKHKLYLFVSNEEAECEQIASIDLYVNPELRVSTISDTQFVCNGGEVSLEGIRESTSNPVRWEWELFDNDGNTIEKHDNNGSVTGVSTYSGYLDRRKLEVALINNTYEAQTISAVLTATNYEGCQFSAQTIHLQVAPKNEPILSLVDFEANTILSSEENGERLEICAPFTANLVGFSPIVIADTTQAEQTIRYFVKESYKGEITERDLDETELNNFVFENTDSDNDRIFNFTMQVEYQNQNSAFIPVDEICKTEVGFEVLVFPTPVSNFTAESDEGDVFEFDTNENFVCQGEGVQFYANGYTKGPIHGYHWSYKEEGTINWTNFPANQVDKDDPYIVLPNSTTKETSYKIRLAVTSNDGCEAVSKEMTVRVAPELTAQFDATDMQGNSVSSLTEKASLKGCGPYDITFSTPIDKLAEGTEVQLFIDGIDQNIDSDPANHEIDPKNTNRLILLSNYQFHNYESRSKTHEVKLRVYIPGSLCEQISSLTIEVAPELSVDFIPVTTMICSGEIAEIRTLQTEGYKAKPAEYYWSMADGTDIDDLVQDGILIEVDDNDADLIATITNQTNSYVDLTFALQLTSRDNCISEAGTVTIRVAPALNPVVSLQDQNGTTLVASDNVDNHIFACSPFVTTIAGIDLLTTPSELDPEYEKMVDYFVIDKSTLSKTPVSENELKNYTFINNDTESDKTYEVLMQVTYRNKNVGFTPTEAICLEEASVLVTIYENPIADFSAKRERGNEFVFSPTEVDDNKVCSEEIVNFKGYSETQGTIRNYAWSYTSENPIDEFAVWTSFTEFDSRTPNQSFENTGDLVVEYSVRLIVENYDGCMDTSRIMPIFVVPNPKIDFTIDAYDPCENPVEITIINNTTFADDFAWDFGDGTNDTSVNGESVTHSYDLNVEQGFAVDYNITVQATSNIGCVSSNTQAPQTVTIYPEIKADLELKDQVGNNIEDGYVCYGNDVMMLDNSLGRIDTHLWTVTDAAGDIVFTSSEKEPQLATTNLPALKEEASYALKLEIVSPYGCEKWMETSFTVGPKIDPILVVRNQSGEIETAEGGCAPYILNFDLSEATIPTKASVTVNFGDGTSKSFAPNDTKDLMIEHTYDNVSQEYKTHYAELSIHYISDEFGQECGEKSELFRVRVFPFLEAAFSHNVLDYCTPGSVLFINESTGAKSSYWDFGNGEFSTETVPAPVAFPNTSDKDTTYTVSLRVENGERCFDVIEHTIDIAPEMTPGLRVNSTEGCSPFQVTIYNEAQNAPESVWLDFGDGSTPVLMTGKESIVHEYDNEELFDQFYGLTLTADNGKGCTKDSTIQIHAKPRISADFEMSETAGCSPLLVGFENKSFGASNYEWNFGDGSETQAIANPYHKFYREAETKTTYTVTLKSTSPYGCNSMTSKNVEVSPSATVAFDVSPDEGCNPLEVTVQNNSMYAQTYRWDFGNEEAKYEEDYATAPKSFSYTYINEDAYSLKQTISLTAIHSSGCENEMTHEVITHPEVQAKISVDTLGCAPFHLILQNETKHANYYEWDFGDGTTSDQFSPAHTFLVEGDEDVYYTVRMIAYSATGCSDTAEVRVHVYPEIVSHFEVNTISGCSPLDLKLDNKSIHAETYDWDFDDGHTYHSNNSELNIEHTIVNERTVPVAYDVLLTAINEVGCTNTFTKTITVNPRAKAQFEMIYDGNCSPLEVMFDNQSTAAENFEWFFGDGSETNLEFEPVHTYKNATESDQNLKVSLVATSYFGCGDTLTKDLLVQRAPETEFDVEPIFQVWPENEVTVTNLTDDKDWSYAWHFGEESEGWIHEHEPETYAYKKSGKYVVTLEGSGEHCSTSVIQNIRIYPGEPVAEFTPDTIGCSPLRIQFQNQSKNAEQYYWSFGDGHYSNEREPEHTFYEEGIYTVELTIENELGTKDNTTRQVQVLPVPDAFFNISQRRVKIPGENVKFTNLSTNNNENLWDFGDGTTSVEVSPYKGYTKIGYFDVKLTVTTLEGCKDSLMIEEAVAAESDGYLMCPNAFIPLESGPTDGSYIPGNSRNQIFYAIPLIDDLEYFYIQIFNRYGLLLFESKDINIGWDGYYRGKLCSQDTYIWKTKIKFGGGKNSVQNGSVTLLR